MTIGRKCTDNPPGNCAGNGDVCDPAGPPCADASDCIPNPLFGDNTALDPDYFPGANAISGGWFNGGIADTPCPLLALGCPADLDGDGSVGPSDRALLLGAWGANPGHPADLDGDGFVDAADLGILLGSSDPSIRQGDAGSFPNNQVLVAQLSVPLGEGVSGVVDMFWRDLDTGLTITSTVAIECGCIEGTSCDDDNPCTENDTCTNGVCAGTIICEEACCFPNGACGDILPQDCAKFGGTPQGAGTQCAFTGCAACPADFDGNGVVEAADLAQLLSDWGDCPIPSSICPDSNNDCCEPSPDNTPGCNDACCECICNCDPFCCALDPEPNGFWDFLCAGCGIDGLCGASNPNSGCAILCAECVDPVMCPP